MDRQRWYGAMASEPLSQRYRLWSGQATWTVSIPAAGDYEVFAWWGANANRATVAPFTINHDGGLTTIDVNQEINGSQWNSLGTYSFSVGDYMVVLSDDADKYVIADAIWWKSVE